MTHPKRDAGFGGWSPTHRPKGKARIVDRRSLEEKRRLLPALRTDEELRAEAEAIAASWGLPLAMTLAGLEPQATELREARRR